VAESFFSLSAADQREVLEIAREQTGRPSHLLEKDVWVVWALGALFNSPIGADLTFKGGTSLSKVYKVIDRFSEDIDLTLDIRKLIPDLIGDQCRDELVLPESRSQAAKWTKAVRDRLPVWIGQTVRPVIEAALAKEGLHARLEVGGKDQDQLLLHYPALKVGTGYVSPLTLLEFGGRATGEPHQAMQVTCDMAGHVPNVDFPTAMPVVMNVARTFWEKATAAHVYCAQGRIRSERFARHWHDLAAIGRSQYFTESIANRTVAIAVARHKSVFFTEKTPTGDIIDYQSAVTGNLKIVPQGDARRALASDYANMLADQVMVGKALAFDDLMLACLDIENRANCV
jgi:hypothetical protein